MRKEREGRGRKEEGEGGKREEEEEGERENITRCECMFTNGQ